MLEWAGTEMSEHRQSRDCLQWIDGELMEEVAACVSQEDQT